MSSDKITLFVGDIYEYLALAAKSHDPSAVLITSDNDRILKPGTYYTSLGDLNDLQMFSNYLRQAHEIHYCEPEKWSNQMLKKWTEDYLCVFACDYNKTIQGYSNTEYEKIDKMLWLPDHRKSDSPQIWTVGCSISHGVGVTDKQKYGHLIAQSLDMPVSFLTKPGSSIEWAASQILRSNIKKGDIIFWGLTSPERIHYWNEISLCVDTCVSNEFKHPAKKPLHTFLKKQYFVHEHTIFKALESISIVENMMNKIGATLIMGTVMCGLEKFITPKHNMIILAGIFGKNSNDMFLDLGSDSVHPGPMAHQYYHDKFIETYKRLKK